MSTLNALCELGGCLLPEPQVSSVCYALSHRHTVQDIEIKKEPLGSNAHKYLSRTLFSEKNEHRLGPNQRIKELGLPEPTRFKELHFTTECFWHTFFETNPLRLLLALTPL